MRININWKWITDKKLLLWVVFWNSHLDYVWKLLSVNIKWGLRFLLFHLHCCTKRLSTTCNLGTNLYNLNCFVQWLFINSTFYSLFSYKVECHCASFRIYGFHSEGNKGWMKMSLTVTLSCSVSLSTFISTPCILCASKQ